MFCNVCIVLRVQKRTKYRIVTKTTDSTFPKKKTIPNRLDYYIIWLYDWNHNQKCWTVKPKSKKCCSHLLRIAGKIIQKSSLFILSLHKFEIFDNRFSWNGLACGIIYQCSSINPLMMDHEWKKNNNSTCNTSIIFQHLWENESMNWDRYFYQSRIIMNISPYIFYATHLGSDLRSHF